MVGEGREVSSLSQRSSGSGSVESLRSERERERGRVREGEESARCNGAFWWSPDVAASWAAAAVMAARPMGGQGEG